MEGKRHYILNHLRIELCSLGKDKSFLKGNPVGGELSPIFCYIAIKKCHLSFHPSIYFLIFGFVTRLLTIQLNFRHTICNFCVIQAINLQNSSIHDSGQKTIQHAFYIAAPLNHIEL